MSIEWYCEGRFLQLEFYEQDVFCQVVFGGMFLRGVHKMAKRDY